MIPQELFVAEFYKSEKGTEKASDTDIRKGMKSARLLVLARELYTFLIVHYINQKNVLRL